VSRHSIRSRRVVFADGVRPATLVIDGETIAEVLPHDAAANEDFGDLAISPGVVDAHVHVNEPGHTDWEGFETATRAAAAGGVTTIVDMPLNSLPVTTTTAALAAKRAAATGKCWVDVGFYGGLVPGNAKEVDALCDAGVLGVKAFLCHSGLDEFPNATEADLRAAMPILARRGVPLLVHAELMTASGPAMSDVRSFAQFAASRPAAWETDAIALLIRLCREFRCPVHIVHLATAEAIPMLDAAQREGLPITVETCPHYLFFRDAPIHDGDTRFKCAPPIRRGEWQRLWDSLQAGVIDTVGSDHSPCPPGMKCLDTGDFSNAWGGIASLQLTLPAVWTFMMSQGCKDLTKLAKWLSAEPARLIRLSNRKGRIAPGHDADFVVWDPEAHWKVEGEALFHRNKPTPYDGFEMSGAVQRTFVRGQVVFDGCHRDTPAGHGLQRRE
jgi:allantoinase